MPWALVECDTHWQAIMAGRKRGQLASRPPFICTPPAAACRSLFLSLRIKAKPFLRLPLMPAAPASRGHGGAAAGHDPAVVDFRFGEPGIVRAGVESWQVSHAEEDQPWLTLGVGIANPLGWPRAVEMCLCWHQRLCSRKRGLGGNFGHWGLKIPPICSPERD